FYELASLRGLTDPSLTPVRGLCDRAGRFERGDLVGREAPLGERGDGVGARGDRRALDRGRRTAEPGRGCRLGRTAHVDERLALDVVRVRARLRHREQWREAHLVAGEELDPLGGRARLE